MPSDKPAGGGATGWSSTNWGSSSPSGRRGGSPGGGAPSGQQPLVTTSLMINPQTGELAYQGEKEYSYYGSEKGSVMEVFHGGHLVPVTVTYYDSKGNVIRVEKKAEVDYSLPTFNPDKGIYEVQSKPFFGVDTSGGDWFPIHSEGGKIYRDEVPAVKQEPQPPAVQAEPAKAFGGGYAASNAPAVTDVLKDTLIPAEATHRVLEITDPQGRVTKMDVPPGSDISGLMAGTSALNKDVAAGYNISLITYTAPSFDEQMKAQAAAMGGYWVEDQPGYSRVHVTRGGKEVLSYDIGEGSQFATQEDANKWFYGQSAVGRLEKGIGDVPVLGGFLVSGTPGFDLPIIGKYGGAKVYQLVPVIGGTAVLTASSVDLYGAYSKQAKIAGGWGVYLPQVARETGLRAAGLVGPMNIIPEVREATGRGLSEAWEGRAQIIGTGITFGLVAGTLKSLELRSNVARKAALEKYYEENPEVIRTYATEVGEGSQLGYTETGGTKELRYLNIKNQPLGQYEIREPGILNEAMYQEYLAAQRGADIPLKDVNKLTSSVYFKGGQKLVSKYIQEYPGGTYTSGFIVLEGEGFGTITQNLEATANLGRGVIRSTLTTGKVIYPTTEVVLSTNVPDSWLLDNRQVIGSAKPLTFKEAYELAENKARIEKFSDYLLKTPEENVRYGMESLFTGRALKMNIPTEGTAAGGTLTTEKFIYLNPKAPEGLILQPSEADIPSIHYFTTSQLSGKNYDLRLTEGDKALIQYWKTQDTDAVKKEFAQYGGTPFGASEPSGGVIAELLRSKIKAKEVQGILVKAEQVPTSKLVEMSYEPVVYPPNVINIIAGAAGGERELEDISIGKSIGIPPLKVTEFREVLLGKETEPIVNVPAEPVVGTKEELKVSKITGITGVTGISGRVDLTPSEVEVPGERESYKVDIRQLERTVIEPATQQSTKIIFRITEPGPVVPDINIPQIPRGGGGGSLGGDRELTLFFAPRKVKKGRYALEPFADWGSKTFTEFATGKAATSPRVKTARKYWLKSFGLFVPTEEMLRGKVGGKKSKGVDLWLI